MRTDTAPAIYAYPDGTFGVGRVMPFGSSSGKMVADSSIVWSGLSYRTVIRKTSQISASSVASALWRVGRVSGMDCSMAHGCR